MRIAALLLVASLPVAVAAPREVRPGPPLDTPRAAHTATLLADGRVLVAGGCTRASCELDEDGRTTELYDPARAEFSAGPKLLRPRVGHAAVRLADGRVLIAGGWDSVGLTKAAELYDPARGAFVATRSLVQARGGFTATRLRDGRVLFAGGARDGRALTSAELYDPRTGTFATTGALRRPRAAHAAVRLRDGRVLVVGGSANDVVIPSAEVFDPKTGRWTPAGRLRTARHKHAAVLLLDGRVLVVGGSDARDWRGRLATTELWHPRARRFSAGPRMTSRRFKLPDAVVPMPSGRVLVAGGGSTAEVFDPIRRRFSSAGSFGVDLFFATATLLRSGGVLVAGGYDGNIVVGGRAWLLR